MNEFTAKKLGEVLAFCQVGVETFRKGEEAFVTAFQGHSLEELIASLEAQASQIEQVADTAGMGEVTRAKAEGTSGKLRTMRDTYVGDEWDNPAELMEWSGFFEGAAIVHWALVEGAAKALEDRDLEELADDGKDFHEDLLEAVEQALERIGQERAKA